MEVQNWHLMETSVNENGQESSDLGSDQSKVFVEILVRQQSTASDSAIASLVRKRIKDKLHYVRGEREGGISLKHLKKQLMVGGGVSKEHVENLELEDADGTDLLVISSFADARWAFYVYRMQKEAAFEDTIGEDVTATVERVLPNREYYRLWESLVYDTSVKRELLNYAMTTVNFSELGIDTNLVTWNKVILLHGPPGTGKTSLCKALAQKLAIRLTEQYSCLHLVEINSHSLFSRWFSESGKLVMKMFEKIEDIVRIQNVFVCLLIDEVESLARARQASLSGNEPSDAVRAVNALLTQIDKIKQYPNVLILTTSNISEAIDLAFVDRADVKLYIGSPSEDAILTICLSFLEELIKKGVLNSDPALLSTEDTFIKKSLRKFASACKGLSGRSLRKLPFLAYAEYYPTKMGIGLEEFIDALTKTARKYQTDLKILAASGS